MRRNAWLAIALLLSADARAEYVRFVYTPAVIKPDAPDANDTPPAAVPGRPGPEEADFPADIIVEVKKIHRLATRAQSVPLFLLEHKWGRTHATELPGLTFYRVEDKSTGLPTTRQRYETRRLELGKTPTPERRLELADYCLTHGLPGKFHVEMEELVKTHPDLPAAVRYKAYLQETKRSPSQKDDTLPWKDHLRAYKAAESAHYRLLHAPGTDAAEVRARLRQLEETFEAFHGWFALKGRAVPLPERRLAVVLPGKTEEFTRLRRASDAAELRGDGFLTRRDNVLVLSPVPLYGPYDQLSKATQDLWVQRGWNRDTLLQGIGKLGESAEDTVYAQEVALLLKAMQEQSELATETHLGSVQLAVAAGLLPGSAAAPRWLHFGLGSLFETPPEAYWPGAGAPHWKYLLKFQLWREKKLLDSPEVALRKVITDAYYRQVSPAEARLRDRDPLLLAHTLSWSLTYFLSQKANRLDGLMRYCQELSRLPRNQAFNEKVYLGCFLRAFDLDDPRGPGGVNTRRFQELAREWFQFMRDTNLEVPESWTRAREEEEQRARTVAARQKASGPP